VTERHYAPWTASRQELVEADLARVWSQDPVALLEMKGTCRWSRRCSIAGAADGRLVVEATMGSLVVVVVGPGLEF
jgi:hypothetical protein